VSRIQLALKGSSRSCTPLQASDGFIHAESLL